MAPLPTLPDGRIDARSLDHAGVRELLRQADGHDHPSLDLRANLLFQHLWAADTRSFEGSYRLSGETKAALADLAAVSALESAGVLDSSDGTRKYLWRCSDGSTIESVLIPDGDRERYDGLPAPPRLTLCVSSQVGCAMKCSFCLTGDLGLKRNLTPGEIASQPLQVQATLPPGVRITNIVMMGMGEPLHNYDNLVAALRIMLDGHGLNFSHRRLTVSTVGLVPAMQRLAAELPVNIAISLNATTEEQRRQVMPLTRRYSLATLIEACRTLPLPAGKRIAFEYVMMAGFNDSLEDADRLVDLLDGVKAKVNLIPYNENPDRTILRPSAAQVKAFQHRLVTRRLHCSVRTTKGRDISAACGQLGKGALQRVQDGIPMWVPPWSRGERGEREGGLPSAIPSK